MSASLQSRPDAALREGDTIWCRRRAHRAALLLDGAGYFGALRSALLQARQSVIIAGWDIDSRTRLVGADRSPDDDGPAEFRQFLEYLVGRRDDLVVRLLLWDYSILYALEREPLPAVNLDWRTPSRVIVALDDALPIGGAHHQKLVVIDDTLAFCGGLDITVNRWDTPEHRPNHPERRGPSGEPYAPFHDVQMVVDGEAAAGLGQLVRERWKRATDSEPDPVVDASPIWPDGVVAEFENVDIGIARTLPEDDDQRQVAEVKALYLESIRQARRYIYIENQYLTVEPVAEALASRLREEPELEVVAVTPRRPSGWLETKTMGTGQALFMASLSDKDIRDRVRFYYPFSGQGDDRTAVMVHAKLMIVDDVLLHVGSSNLNRRSMGLDSECDLAIEAQCESEVRQVQAVLCRLLAHHFGLTSDTVRERLEAQASLIRTIDALESTKRGLHPLEPAEEYNDVIAETLNRVADREAPLDPEVFVGDMFDAVPQKKTVRRAIRLVSVAIVLAALVALWNYTPLAEWTDPEKVAAALESFRASRWTMLILLSAYVLGGLVLFPLTVLITVTGMVLGPWIGFLCAVIGSLVSAAAGFGLGHVTGRGTIRHLLGRRYRTVRRAVARRGLVTVAVVRMVPVAPYTIVNMALGAIGVGFWHYLWGTLLGLLPGILALTLLGDRLLQVWRNPDPVNIIWFVLAIVIWLALALGLQRLATRLKED
jgi:phospholipase D1/2